MMHRLSAHISWLLIAAIACGCAKTRTNVTFRESSFEQRTEALPAEARDPEPRLQEDRVRISVEEAVFSALRHNKDLFVQQMNPIIAGTFDEIERGVYDPDFFAGFDYSRESVSETDRATGTQFAVEGSDYEGETGLRQKLPTGTDLEISVRQGRTISDRSPEQEAARIGLSVTQSLLQGMGPKVNLARLKQAQYETLASVYELKGYVEALVSEVEIAYWQYVLAHKQIDIYERSLKIAMQQHDEIQQKIEVGSIPRTEAAAARTEVALREQGLIDARSTLEERRLRLARLVNPTQDGRLDIRIDAVSEPAAGTASLGDVDERARLAQTMRPELKEAELRLLKNELEVMVTRNGLLPRLELFINLGKTGFADTFQESFRDIDGPTYDASAGFQFSYALGNRASKARHLAARATRRQAEKAVDNLRQLVRQDVLIAANELERLRKQIAASAQTRAFQELTVTAEKERFDVGASTSLQLAQAQRDLLQSQIAEINALTNYRSQLVRLYLAEGTLLERRGIQVESYQEQARNALLKDR